MENITQAIVLDNGTFEIKAGFEQEVKPKIFSSTIIGTLINPTQTTELKETEYIGNEAQKQRELLNLTYPIERGIIKDWGNIEKIWNDIFLNQLKIDPKDHSILITEPLMNPNASREKTAQIMFETFGFRSFHITNPGPLILISHGRDTKMIVDIGHGILSTHPFYQGFGIPQAIHQYNFSGTDITNYLINLLGEKGYSFKTSAEIEIAREIKEKFCYCSLNYQEEIKENNKSQLEKEFELKNGDIITFSDERIKCCEGLFDPRLMGLDFEGIHQLIYNSIMETPVDVRKDLAANIVLVGGTTFFPNFQQRLQKELDSLFSGKLRISVNASPNRKIFSWIGGSLFNSVFTSENLWISKDQYIEVGPSVVHKKK
ncbi:actin cytoskeletal 1b [Anaeramoeba ignava]|uniref:Actin cytoskeletal 1b n=1 Tax=Anaeramoeba ignava TaxID=1746090 RepID=A0A9Q0LD47_ANAIG|nr:actin cytoskeletal 1b [Anaeramoeba ignava]